jgi:hypothetical protein
MEREDEEENDTGVAAGKRKVSREICLGMESKLGVQASPITMRTRHRFVKSK